MALRDVSPLRLGIDLGGTKIAFSVFGPGGDVRHAARQASPQGDYEATVRALKDIVDATGARFDFPMTVGIGMPGSISPGTERVQNANSTWLNGQPLKADLETAVGREVRFANDANCFALSEAIDGAGQGFGSVFGVILGTGTGGGFVVDGRVVDGPRGTGGEWGHVPLPWADERDHPMQTCWCGRVGCLETWLSGPGLERTYAITTGVHRSSEDIVSRASTDADAALVLDRHAHRLARGLAMIANIIDPHVIVLGGGLSKLAHLYRDVPDMMRPYLFTDTPTVTLKSPLWGDAGGVRGAAWLWGGPPSPSRTLY